MFAMNAGTSRAVLISEDSDDNVAQVEELLVCRGVNVILDRVQLRRVGKSSSVLEPAGVG